MLSSTKPYQLGVRLLTIPFLCFVLASCAMWRESNTERQRTAEIHAFYESWKGTEYQYGGSGGQGIDCSALMVRAYKDIFGISLPRTTEDQASLGKRVRLKKARSGDLVFFKTGLSRRHVGIFLEDGFFVHSSASTGVMKSSINSEYWQKHFWKVKRVAAN